MAFSEKYCRDDAAGGGDGTTNTNSGANGAWTLAEAITNATAGDRVNIRAGTYANTTTARNFNGAGTTTAPLWWRGFTSAAGDLDAVPTSTRVAGTDIPTITFTTAGMTISGAHQIFSNIDITGARTAGTQLSCTSSHLRLHRVRVENTGTNANSSAVSLDAASANCFTSCWFKSTSSATRILNATSRMLQAHGCVFIGGGIGVDISTGTVVLLRCVFDALGSHAVNMSAAGYMQADGCTFIGGSADGVRYAATPGTTNGVNAITNSIFESLANGINNQSGTNTNLVFRDRNYFRNCTNNEVNLGDSPSYNDVTSDAASPFNGASDRGIISTSLAKAAGIPGLFENVSYSGYLDLGAVQRQESGSGGGAGPLIGPGRLIRA